MSVEIRVNNIDRSHLIQMGSFEYEDQINQATDTAEFVIRKWQSQTYAPAVNDEITVRVDGELRFGGVITTLDTFVDQPTIAEFTYTAQDFSFYMNRLRVVERYTDTTLNALVLDLISRYASTYGFTTNNVQGLEIDVKSIAFNEITLSECFDNIARLTNYVWYVDATKDVHFLKKNDDPAPFNLTDTSGNYIFNTLAISNDFTQIRNSVKVRGGEAEAAVRTELLIGNAEATQFPLANKFSSLPVVTVDGTALTVGIDFLQQDEDYQVMWDFNQKYLRFTDGNIPGAPITGTTNITTTGIPLKPIVVVRTNSVSIAKYGLFEHTLRNNDIRTRDEALQFAQADLQEYADKITGGKFNTYVPGLKSGQTIRINSQFHNSNALYIIQSVGFQMVSKDLHVYSIRVATVKTLSMIDFLQKLLLRERIQIGEDETLLSFFQFNDTFTATDTLGAITSTTSEDYVVEQNVPGSDSYTNPALVNKSTISA
jgi:hypothetical protein